MRNEWLIKQALKRLVKVRIENGGRRYCNIDEDESVTWEEIVKWIDSAALMRWRPIKYRPMNDDEIKIYGEEYDEANVYDCELPDDGQEVLITTSCGTVEKTTFVRDHRNYCYFEDYEDETEVIAWMPAPERYKAESEG